MGGVGRSDWGRVPNLAGDECNGFDGFLDKPDTSDDDPNARSEHCQDGKYENVERKQRHDLDDFPTLGIPRQIFHPAGKGHTAGSYGILADGCGECWDNLDQSYAQQEAEQDRGQQYSGQIFYDRHSKKIGGLRGSMGVPAYIRSSRAPKTQPLPSFWSPSEGVLPLPAS